MLDQEDTKPLSVAIIGAGIGGLVCAIACRRQGLQVTVLEQAHEIKAVGAGIQIPPNASRVLASLDVLHLVEQVANDVKHLKLRRYKDGEILANRPVGRNGMPWLVIHRADYHKVLLQEAERLGTKVVLNTKVVGLDAHNGTVTSEDDRELAADVIVGGDGLWSVTRSLVLDRFSEPSETGDLAYRATFSLEELEELNDPRVTELCQYQGVSVWVGPNKHCVFYPLHKGTQFNLVLLRPDNMPAGERTLSGDIEEMRETFEGWDTLLTKIISCISSVFKWKLMHHSELERWVKGCVALLGDSCHPTLPYQAQGAAMAVEDGGIIGNLIGRLNHELLKGVIPQSRRRESINAVLGLYEQSQKNRTTVNVKGAISNRAFFHLPDGSEQEDRDKELAQHTFKNERSGYMWCDMPYNRQLLDADVICDASDRFDGWLGKNF